MPFDPLLFNGGLKCAGMPYQVKSGIQHYTVKAYADLNHLLGNGWHFRGLNANGDYSYIVLNTIDYMHCRNLDHLLSICHQGLETINLPLQ